MSSKIACSGGQTITYKRATPLNSFHVSIKPLGNSIDEVCVREMDRGMLMALVVLSLCAVPTASFVVVTTCNQDWLPNSVYRRHLDTVLKYLIDQTRYHVPGSYCDYPTDDKGYMPVWGRGVCYNTDEAACHGCIIKAKKEIVDTSCKQHVGGRTIMADCYLRFENYNFYDALE